MIVYLVTGAHAYTMQTFLTDWAPADAPHVQIMSYTALKSTSLLPPATYVFSDLERLSKPELAWAGAVASRLEAAGLRVLNHPARVAQRYELLRLLHERGENSFAIYRLSETRHPARYPVLIRPERDHRAFGELIETPEELDTALWRARHQGYGPDQLLMVEYCDTSDEQGVFRKYGAFIIGDRIIPRHIYFAREWRVQTPLIANAETVREEREYLSANPHEGWLRSVFERARIDYGRIDYSFLEGRPQTWEINTNPLTLHPRGEYGPLALPLKEHIARELTAALVTIDTAIDPTKGFSVSVPAGRLL